MAGLFHLRPQIHCHVVPDGIGGKKMTGPNGEEVFPGLLSVPESDWRIIDGRPVRVFKLHAQVWLNGNSLEWDFELTEEEFNHLDKNLPRFMPDGVTLTIKDLTMLRNAVLALTSKDPDLCYISTTSYWTDKDGIRLNGRLICKPIVQISGERKNELNETIYRLRCGERYFDVTFAELQTANWQYRMAENGRIFDPLGTFVALREQWNNLTASQKESLRNEEVQAKARAHRKELEEQEQRARWRI